MSPTVDGRCVIYILGKRAHVDLLIEASLDFIRMANTTNVADSCLLFKREKERDLSQSYDKSPFTYRKIKIATSQHKNAIKNFDYTTISDRHRTVSWSNSSHSTGLAKPVYERRSTFPLTATAL